jgi:hypothetical protein
VITIPPEAALAELDDVATPFTADAREPAAASSR